MKANFTFSQKNEGKDEDFQSTGITWFNLLKNAQATESHRHRYISSAYFGSNIPFASNEVSQTKVSIWWRCRLPITWKKKKHSILEARSQLDWPLNIVRTKLVIVKQTLTTHRVTRLEHFYFLPDSPTKRCQLSHESSDGGCTIFAQYYLIQCLGSEKSAKSSVWEWKVWAPAYCGAQMLTITSPLSCWSSLYTLFFFFFYIYIPFTQFLHLHTSNGQGETLNQW